jgi:hypothetical protein
MPKKQRGLGKVRGFPIKKGGRMVRVKRKDIRLEPLLVKEESYEEIHKLYKSGVPVEIKQHRSGFPAVTVDCGETHILTDILSLEEWWRKMKEAGRT